MRESTTHHGRDQWPMNHQTRIPLGLRDIRMVIVNPVTIERHGRIPKQQHWAGVDQLAPLRCRSGFCALQLWRTWFTVHNILLFAHHELSTLLNVMLNRDK